MSVHQSTKKKALVSWITDKVKSWEVDRDSKFMQRWEVYERIWRGIWAAQDKHRVKERSKLIPPQLMESVDIATANLEDAFFSRTQWFNLDDDFRSKIQSEVQQNQQMLQGAQIQGADPAQVTQVQQRNASLGAEINRLETLRDQLLEDMKKAGVTRAMSECILMGAIYGTLIGKVVTEEVDENVQTQRINLETGQITTTQTTEKQVRVFLEPILPDEFVIDTSVTKPGTDGIEQALGVAHVVQVPRHKVLAKQKDGTYAEVELKPMPQQTDINKKKAPSDDSIKIIEWHGLVPAELLGEDEEVVQNDEVKAALDRLVVGGDDPVVFKLEDEANLVEAIVTIANDNTWLAANPTPHKMKDRSFVAAPYDTIPKSFWGRGLIEKGFHPHKALEAELRARIDALAYAVTPVMGVNLSHQPKSNTLSVFPGKIFPTPGDPRQSIYPFKFSDVSASSFHQSGELERMIQSATGQVSGSTPIQVNSRNNTTSGMSILNTDMLRRAKRTVRNIEQLFLTKFVEKAAWRYQQFNPDRYPLQDFDFVVSGAMATMAREVEQAQFIQLLAFMPQDGKLSPEFSILLNGIVENSSLPNKEELKRTLELRLQPNPDEELLRQFTIADAQLDLELKRAEIAKTQSESVKNLGLTQYNTQRLDVEIAKEILKSSENQKDRVQAIIENIISAQTVEGVVESETVPEPVVG